MILKAVPIVHSRTQHKSDDAHLHAFYITKYVIALVYNKMESCLFVEGFDYPTLFIHNPQISYIGLLAINITP